MKQSVFADKRFEQQLPIWIGFFTPFLPLTAYMIGPYLLISRHTVVPAWVYAAAPALCIFGVFMHYVSDAQKYFVLKLRKGLIEDGLFAHTQNLIQSARLGFVGAPVWFFRHQLRQSEQKL
jgi:hypothetical protein